jgi:hypothetical protein
VQIAIANARLATRFLSRDTPLPTRIVPGNVSPFHEFLTPKAANYIAFFRLNIKVD